MRLLNRFRIGPGLRALALATGFVVPAATAQAEYVGGGYLTNARGCDAAGWPTMIEMFRARYVPSGNGRISTVVLDLAVGGTMIYNLRGDLNESRRWLRGSGYAVWGGLYRSRPLPRVQVLQRMSATTGNARVPGHEQIRMSLRIRNFNGRGGCTVDAHMMLRDPQAPGVAY